MTAGPVTVSNAKAATPVSPTGDSEALAVQVRRSALWSIASGAVLRLAGLLVTAIVAHILHPRDFGVFAVAATAYAIVGSLGELGASACLIRADLDIDSLAPTVATVSFIINALFACAMAVFAGPIAAALGAVGAANAVRVMAIAVLLIGVFAVPSAHLARDFRQDKLFIANVISFVPSTALLLFLSEHGSGAMALAWSRVLGQVIVGSVLVISVPKRYRPGLTRRAVSLLIKFGLPLAGANFVNYILLNVDYALVGHLMRAVLLGIYVLAFNVASWPASLLGTMINNVSMPAFSRVKHDDALLRRSIADALRAVSFIVLPMCALMAVLSKPLVLVMYGAQWTASAKVLSVLAAYGAMSIICVLFANMLASIGRTRLLLVLQLVWIGTLLPTMALGVIRDGIVGASLAHVFVIGLVVLPAYVIALRKTTGIHIRTLIGAAAPALLGATAAALAAHAVMSQIDIPLVQLLAGGATGGIVYLIVLAPQAVALVNRGFSSTRGARITRAYSIAARVVGLPSEIQPRHSKRGAEQSAPYTPSPRYPPSPGNVYSAQLASSQDAALQLLLSLSLRAVSRAADNPVIGAGVAD